MKTTIYLLFFLLFSIPSFSQLLLKDITTSNASSHPRSMVNANGTLYFQVKGLNNSSTEFWKTDGTNAGTISINNSFSTSNTPAAIGNSLLFGAYSYSPTSTGNELFINDGSSTSLLKDINVGSNSSYPSNFINLGANKVVFTADNGTTGTELWVTDGTSSGTFLLKDIYPGSSSSSPFSYPYTVNNGKLYFQANDGTTGYEPWITDGTSAGTYLLSDINSGSGSSSAGNPNGFIAAGSKVFFSATSATNGNELWATDGTAAGTAMVKDIVVGSNSSAPFSLTTLNNTIVFVASDATYDTELWISDGTAANTYRIKDINPSGNSYPINLTKIGNTVFFGASDGTNGIELWKSDGTAAGTSMIKNINATSTGTTNYTFIANSWQRFFYNANGTLYFLANSGAEGFELWKSDGTTAGTSLVKDFVSGGVSATYSLFNVVGSNLYFAVNDDTGQTNFWKTDGTNAGTVKVSSLTPSLAIENIYPILVVGNQLYFSAYNATTGYELYVTDGTSTTFIKDIDTGTHGDFNDLKYKTGIGNNLLFSYNDNKKGLEIWKTDGTTAQTTLLSDFIAYPYYSGSYYNYYSNSSPLSDIITYNNYAYINGSIGANGSAAIWKTDGTTLSLVQTSNSGVISNLVVMNGKLYWGAGGNLYATDGTTTSTIFTNSSYYNPISNLKVAGGNLYFTFGTPTTGNELWKSDGIVGGTTTMVKDITAGSSSTSFNNDFIAMGNKLFFTLYDNSGRELWVSDGSSAGTFMVKDINPGANSSYPQCLTNYNDNLLLFTADNGTNGFELWKTDGTTSNTSMVVDLASGSYGSQPQNSSIAYVNSTPYTLNALPFAIINSKVYFKAYGSSSYGIGLFVYDGTSVSLIKDAINPNNMIAVGNTLYFDGVENNATTSYEPYKSDGTTAGTVLLKDIVAGGGSFPFNFFYYNDLLYFMATEPNTGLEPYVMKICADNITMNTTLNGSTVIQKNKYIIGDNSNVLTSTSRTTYNAGNYVQLNPGFKTETGAVFLGKIQGCAYDPATPPVAGSSRMSIADKYDAQTVAYLKEESEKPSVEDFIKYSSDKNLPEIYGKYLSEVKPIQAQYAENEQLLYNLSKLSSLVNNINQTITQQSENLFSQKNKIQDSKNKLDQYASYITTLKNDKGEKIGYELTLRILGKEYKSQLKN